MSVQWRLFLVALRAFTRLPIPMVAGGGRETDAAARYMPLVGMIVGALGGGAYWLAASVWPTSVAVVVSMLVTVLATGALHEAGLAGVCAALGRQHSDARAAPHAVLGLVFMLLLKYNALMALSAANLPFAVPANTALGLIVILGHMASRALVVTVIAGRDESGVRHVGTADVVFALLIGFSPAALLGLPGLIGLAAAIVARLAFTACLRGRVGASPGDILGAAQQLTEVSFYLGALAAWTYI
jgi:adenosylcobinamide-GDP ribazoletransferase